MNRPVEDRPVEPRDVGITRDGHRRIAPILGGFVRGLDGTEFEGLRGNVLPGRADRQIWNAYPPTTVVEINANYMAVTDRGFLFNVHATGVRRVSEEGVYFMVQMRFETSAPDLAALQHAVYLANGVREKDFVRHTVY